MGNRWAIDEGGQERRRKIIRINKPKAIIDYKPEVCSFIPSALAEGYKQERIGLVVITVSNWSRTSDLSINSTSLHRLALKTIPYLLICALIVQIISLF